MASQTLLLEVFGPLVVAFGLFVAVYGFRRFVHQFRNRQSPEQLQAARDSFRSRLIHPKTAEVEQAMGALLPERLLTLYDDHQLVLTERIKIRRPEADANGENSAEWIEAFLPLDLESQKFTLDLPARGLGKGFCFATDGAANFYWVPASTTREPDAPVFYAWREPAANEEVAGSLEEFLSWPRTLHGEEGSDQTSPQ
jgi:hypothetical protein